MPKTKERERQSEKATRTSAKIAVARTPAKAVAKLPPKPEYKCPFSKDELGKWRQLLVARRGEISNDIAGLEKDAMEAEDGHTTPNHIAERGSDADLQDVSLGIAGEEKDIIWQIDRALRKIEKGSPIPFGLCEFTKEPISKNRLTLIPWTPLSIEGANHMEENNLVVEDLLADG
jgi:RNA polymerase-binding transcription factor DksA